tara:strand:- start:2344 stop:2502 length:159 start_codon:yes stop_codon:yes gene_type:complete
MSPIRKLLSYVSGRSTRYGRVRGTTVMRTGDPRTLRRRVGLNNYARPRGGMR